MRFINLQENPSPWTLATISDLEGTFYASTLPLDYIEGSQKDEVKQYFKLGKDLLEILRLTLTQKTTLSWSLLKVNADTRFYPQYRNQPGDNPDIELQRKIYNLSSLLSIKEGSLQITEHPLMKARYTTSKYNPEKKLFDTEAYKETESTISNCQPQDGDFSWCNLKNLSGFLTLLKENYKPNELQKASPSSYICLLFSKERLPRSYSRN
jgi:hypothetical protein